MKNVNIQRQDRLIRMRIKHVSDDKYESAVLILSGYSFVAVEAKF